MVKSLPVVWETQVRSMDWEDPWRRKWQPTPIFLPENPTDGGAWQTTVHGTAKSQPRLSNFTFLRIVTNMSCFGSCFPRKQKLHIKGLLENDGPDGDIWLEMALCTTISKEASSL